MAKGNRTTPKKYKVGYELRINRSGKPGKDNWERVGWTFASSYEAKEFLRFNHPTVSTWTVTGIRMNARPVDFSKQPATETTPNSTRTV